MIRLTLPLPDYDEPPKSALAAALRLLKPNPTHRRLLDWAVASAESAFQYVGLTGLLALGETPEVSVIDRFLGSEEELLRLTALGVVAARGDMAAVARLKDAALSASHVVLRARALRSLRRSPVQPEDSRQISMNALKSDHEVFDWYYSPVTEAAAFCLARGGVVGVSESEALTALVEAGLDLSNDEAWWAIEASIKSWLDGTDLANPGSTVWDWMYLYPTDRNAPPGGSARACCSSKSWGGTQVIDSEVLAQCFQGTAANRAMVCERRGDQGSGDLGAKSCQGGARLSEFVPRPRGSLWSRWGERVTGSSAGPANDSGSFIEIL